MTQTHTNCGRCGEPLPDDYAAEAEAAVATLARLSGARLSIQPVCEGCEEALRRLHAANDIAARYKAAHHDGAIPRGLERFRRPPADLVRLNPEPWAHLRGQHNAWLHGPEGVGKSSLAWQMLCRVFERGGTVAAVTGAEFEGRLASFDGEREVDRLASVCALCIDDIEHAAWSGRGVAVLRRVLDERHRLGRVTFVTSNLTPDAVMAALADAAGLANAQSALARLRPLRLVEMCGGKSFRRTLSAPEPVNAAPPPGQGGEISPPAVSQYPRN